MRKTASMLLVLVFLTASCIMVAKPALSSADLAENSWTPKAPMHQARTALGVAAVKGKIYAIGGSTHEGSARDITAEDTVGTNEEYDPATDTWIFKEPMPTPRNGFAIATFDDKIYCIGGYLSNGAVTGINEVYDPATDTWETKAPMLTPRIGLKANAAYGKIYLIGGYVKKPGDLLLTFNITYSSLNEAYNPANDSWATMKPLPTPVSSYASSVVNGKIFVVGGVSNTSVATLNQVYDAEADTWSQGAAPPSTIAYGVAVATTGINAPKRIYILHQDLSSPDGPFNGNTVLRVYDPEKGSWSSATTPPTNRASYGVAIVNDMLYVIGGGTAAYQTYPDDWVYGPSVTLYAANEQYTPFGFRIVPPVVSLVSPENKTYSSGNLPLVFAVNKPTVWMGYSLDGQETITATGNATLDALAVGLHNITVYANDTFGNTGVSETISFTVAAPEPEPFPTVPVAVASVTSFAVAVVGLLVYFRKRRR